MAESQLNAWIPTLWAREALRHLKANLRLAVRVYRDYSGEFVSQGNVVNVPVPPTLAAAKKAMGSNFTFTAVNASTVPIAMDQHAYAAFEINDIQKIQARPQALEDYGKSAAIAIAEQVETDLFAEYVNAGANVGTPGTNLQKAQVLAARTLLNANKAPLTSGDRTVMLSTKDAESFLNDLSTSEAGALFNDRAALREGEIGRLYGFDIFESQLAPVVAGTPNTTHGLAFHREAIAFVTRPLPLPDPGLGVRGEVVIDPDLQIAIRVLMSFDINSGTHKVVYDVLYGKKVLRPQWVVDLRS